MIDTRGQGVEVSREKDAIVDSWQLAVGRKINSKYLILIIVTVISWMLIKLKADS